MTRKDYRERYKRIGESDFFRKHYADKSTGEVVVILDDVANKQKDIPEEFVDIVNTKFWDIINEQKFTEEEKEKLRSILYENKWIADYKEEDPFVGIYFSDLINLLIKYKLNKLL